MKIYDGPIKCSMPASVINTYYSCHVLPGNGDLLSQTAHGLGNSVWGIFGQGVSQENTADLESGSSGRASMAASSGNKETRAVAGEPARARKPEVQPVSNVPCHLGTCQLGYEHKSRIGRCCIHFSKQNRLLRRHERKN